VVAYNGLSLAAGGWDEAAHQGKTIGLAEREGRGKEKRLFFDTVEATILLKTKEGHCKKGQKQTDLHAQISPKMPPKSRFLLIPHLI
jgi:hypothetical protein